MRRRRFNHLVNEISIEVGSAVPRYALWTRLSELGHDPEALSRKGVLAFCDEALRRFLHEQGMQLTERRARRLRRRIARFDPRYPPPEEVFARL